MISDKLIYLMRHGKTTGNLKDIVESQTESRLSPEGRKTIEESALWFKDKNIDIVLTSSQLRAKETAEILNRVLNKPIIESAGLRERCIGRYEGLEMAELIRIRNLRKDQFIDVTQDWFNVQEVESDQQVFVRVQNVIANYSHHKSILCITHAGVIKSFMHVAFKIPPSMGNCFKIKNCCVFTLITWNFSFFQLLELKNFYGEVKI